MDYQMRSKTGPGFHLTICFDLPISPVISSSGKASFTPCSPKAEEAERGGGFSATTPSSSSSLPIFYTFYTHKFTIHTHTGLTFESPKPDLKFLFRASHAFYMHGES
ncbi:hypothetical protein AMECASPLE_012681 [Ameca splendens]|uniref:Uncharacterized protein n=1 Tax=Ameca splendens TaxID=208324 RepID=A0ABV0Z9Z6_9TELE